MRDPLTNDQDRDSSQRLVDLVAQHYRPDPLSPSERVRFDARLYERTAGQRRSRAWLPSLAAVAAALVLAWWVWPAATPRPEVGSDSIALDSGWEAEVMLVDTAATPAAEEEYLPDDYMAIAYFFIDIDGA